MTSLLQRLDQCIINVKVVSSVQAGQRLIFRGKGIGISEHYVIISSIMRTLAGESRESIIEGLDDFLCSTERLIDEFVQSTELQRSNLSDYERNSANEYLIRLGFLRTELPHVYNDSTRGLNALKETYGDDHETIAKLELIVTKFKLLHAKLDYRINILNQKFDLNQGVLDSYK